MAEVQPVKSQLRLVFEKGFDHSGKPLYRYKNYSNIKTSASADDLLRAAQAIASLQKMPLAKVERNDTHQINA